MRVGLVYQFVYPSVFGGGQKRLYEVCRRLPESWDITWYCAAPPKPEFAEELKRFRFVDCMGGQAESVRSVAGTMKYCWKTARSISYAEHDVLHIGQMPVFHIMFILMFVMMRRFSGKKCPVISVDWWEVWDKYWFDKGKGVGCIGWVIEKLILRFSKRILGISPKTCSDILKHSGRPAALVHNGVDLDAISDAPVNPAPCDLLYAGRIESHKNVGFALEVFHELVKQNGALSFRIVGDGTDLDRVKSQVDKLGLAGHVTFVGQVEDVELHGHLKSARLMLLFATQEGGGSIALFEANAAGLPVATAYYPNGIDAALVQSDVGFFFNKPDAVEISRTLGAYLRDEGDQEIMSAACRRYAEQFHWARIAKCYQAYFLKAVS